MKKIFFLLASVIVMSSCSIGEDPQSEFVLLPVSEVELPTAYKVDSISVFNLKYTRPTDCHIFDGIYYDAVDATRVVGIRAVKLLQGGCSPDDQTVYEVPLRFKPAVSGTYNFKFWLGTNSAGVDEYLNTEVIVP